MNEIIQKKADELAAMISVSEMALDDLDSQIKALQAKKKKRQSELDEFKDNLREGMKENGITRIENHEHGILFRLDAPSVSVKVTDESALPEQFFRVKKEVDKAKLKQYLKDGPIDGAELVEGKHKLTIKV